MIRSFINNPFVSDTVIVTASKIRQMKVIRPRIVRAPRITSPVGT